jgi:chaperone BCS1
MTGMMDNPYFGAGFGLLGLGTGVALLRRGGQLAMEAAKRKYIVSIEIPHTDKSYFWFLNWMGRNVRDTQQLSLVTSFLRRDNGRIETKFDFMPSVGNHFFRFRNTWIHVERSREKSAAAAGTSGGVMWEAVQLRMLGQRKTVLFDLLNEAKSLALKAEEGRTIIFNTFGPEWRPFGFPRKKRPIQSVILPQALGTHILDDVRDFLATPKWYTDRGIPYRRGYLLHGPPGTGKSSFIQALAGELDLNICLLSLSERGLTDDRLNHLLTVAPERSIILLEDVDAAFSARESAAAYGNQVTFSGLLNALDGVAAAEGRILFMTTNHPERLDQALIRPGRVDVKVALTHANKQQIEALFKNFYPEASEEMAERFATQVEPAQLSMAHIQGHFLTNKNNPEAAIANVSTLINRLNPL